MKTSKLIFIAFVLICASTFGQTVKQKRAEREFNSFSFIKAINSYEKLIDTSENGDYARRKLGDSYIMLRQPEKALSIYKEVVQQSNVPSEYFLYYAQTLRANGKYEESKKWMEKYKSAGNEKDSRVEEFFKNDDLASAIFNASEKNTLSKLNINTKFNDFGAVDYNGNIVFASSRDEGVSIKRLYAWDKQPMIDLYEVPLDNATVESTKAISGDVNTIHHDGPAVFNSEGTKMYFSRNNFVDSKKINDDQGIMQLGIFTADLVDGKWTNAKPSSLNNPNYLVYHPSISADGKKLYFASDMPGGFGGTDIYVSDIHEDGSFGEPMNLGKIVNTEGNESFPHIYNEEGILYFSSDGHVGLGLLDVFATVKDENNAIVNVINLGEPINSKYDDFGYYLTKDGLKGYISSNRKGGQGGDDIYAFTRLAPVKILPLMLTGHVRDAINNQFIEGAKVDLTSKEGKALSTVITGEDGYYEHLIDYDEEFILRGSREQYTEAEKRFNSIGLDEKKEQVINVDIVLTPIEDVVVLADLDIIYFDLDKHNIRPDAAFELNKVVDVMNRYPGMIIRLESHTDSRARDQYNLDLSNRRAKSTYQYIVSKGIDASRIAQYEGFGETQLVNNCSNGVKCSEVDHQLNRRTEFIILKMK